MCDEFADILGLLQRHEVAFMVVGGVACALHGFVRVTEDVDVLVQASPANIRRRIRAAGGDKEPQS